MERRQHTAVPKLFICHSSKDKKFAEWLAEKLKSFGIRIWLDKWEIKIGDSIVDKINQGISMSDYLVIILSRNSVESAWVNEELNSGIIRNIESQGAFVLPTVVEDCQIPTLLSHRRFADFRYDKAQGFKELLQAITPTEETFAKELENLLEQFDALVRKIESEVNQSDLPKEVLPSLFEINWLMEEAVHLRTTFELNSNPSDVSDFRWNVFWDELRLLKKRGLNLQSNPTWGLLRNIRNNYYHSCKANWWEDMIPEIQGLVTQLGNIREVLVRLMTVQ
jgi:hypothetical protein